MPSWKKHEGSMPSSKIDEGSMPSFEFYEGLRPAMVKDRNNRTGQKYKEDFSSKIGNAQVLNQNSNGHVMKIAECDNCPSQEIDI